MATGPLRTVEVREEKGSDVNLSSHLLVDAFNREFELAVVVSKDSDLVWPIDAVRRLFGRQVGVLNPTFNFSGALFKVATFYKKVPRSALATCQFPDPMTDAAGTFNKPQGW